MKYLGRFVTLILIIINTIFVVLMLMAAFSSHLHPSAYPTLSCMSLTFPIFLFINLLFLCLWLAIQLYKCALLPLLALLMCWSQIAAFLPLHSESKPEELPKQHIKLLSYNVMRFNKYQKTNGKNAILKYLKDSQADIICLQEYDAGKSSKYLTKKEIEEALKQYPYRRIHTVVTSKKSLNQTAGYSKYPILSAKELNFPGLHNGSVAYQMKIGKDTLLLINNHLESNRLKRQDKEVYEEILSSPQTEKVKSGSRQLLQKLANAAVVRARQADAIAKEIEQSKQKYIVVCGDFNDTTLSYSYRTIGKHLNDAFTESGCGLGVSYNKNKFYFRIDHILHSVNMKAFNCKVDNSIKESDHYPISCLLTFENTIN